jgi:hypothetical protein
MLLSKARKRDIVGDFRQTGGGYPLGNDSTDCTFHLDLVVAHENEG